MNQQYFQRLTQIMRNVQKPLQAITELNIKTMQNLSYMKPDELIQIKPEEFFERQVNLAIENGHKTLDYMQKTFEILEKSALTTNDKLRESTNSLLDKTYPGNNMGIASATSMPSNIMMDMAQTVFDPMNNPIMGAAREAFNPTIPTEKRSKSTSNHPKHAKSKTKQATHQASSKQNKSSTINKEKSQSSGKQASSSSTTHDHKHTQAKNTQAKSKNKEKSVK